MWDNPARQETTITIHDLNADLVAALGGDDTVMSAINDLLAALTLTSYKQGDESGYDLNMSGKSVFGGSALAVETEDGTINYSSSKLFGGVIAINSKDMEAITEKYLRANMKMAGQSDEDIEKALAEAKEELGDSAEYTAMLEAMTELQQMTPEQFVEELAKVDNAAYATMVNDMVSNAVTEEVTEQPGDCDAAATKTTMTLPKEQANNAGAAMMDMLHSVPSIGAYLDAVLSAGQSSWDEFVQALSAQEVYASDIVTELWLDADSVPVRVNVTLAVDNGGEEPLPVTVLVTRNTADGVATWLTTTKSVDDTVATMTFAGDLVNFKANLTIYADADTVEINVSGENVGTGNSVVDVEIKDTSDGDTQGFGAVVTTATTMDGEQGVRKVDVLVRFMGLDVVTITAETRTCDAKDALDVSKAQDLGAMTDSEFQTWYVKVMNNVQNLPMTIMMSLPESVLTLLMGGSN